VLIYDGGGEASDRRFLSVPLSLVSDGAIVIALLIGDAALLSCTAITNREDLQSRGHSTSDVAAASEVSRLLASRLHSLQSNGDIDLEKQKLYFWKPFGKKYHGKLRAVVEGLVRSATPFFTNAPDVSMVVVIPLSASIRSVSMPHTVAQRQHETNAARAVCARLLTSPTRKPSRAERGGHTRQPCKTREIVVTAKRTAFFLFISILSSWFHVGCAAHEEKLQKLLQRAWV